MSAENWYVRVVMTSPMASACSIGSASATQAMRLLRVAVDTGEVEDLGLRLEGPGHMALSRDGRHLVYTDGTNKMEVWVMENFLPGSGG